MKKITIGKQKYLERKKKYLERRMKYLKWKSRQLQKIRKKSVFYNKVGALHKHGYYQPRRKHTYNFIKSTFNPDPQQKINVDPKSGYRILHTFSKNLPKRKLKEVITKYNGNISDLLAKNTTTYKRPNLSFSNELISIKRKNGLIAGRTNYLEKKESKYTIKFLPTFKRFMASRPKFLSKENRIKIIKGVIENVNPRYRGPLKRYKIMKNTYWYRKSQLNKKKRTSKLKLRLAKHRYEPEFRAVELSAPQLYKLNMAKLKTDKIKSKFLTYLRFKNFRKLTAKKKLKQYNSKRKKANIQKKWKTKFIKTIKRVNTKKLKDLNNLKKYNIQLKSRWYKFGHATTRFKKQKFHFFRRSRRYKVMKKIKSSKKLLSKLFGPRGLIKIRRNRYRRLRWNTHVKRLSRHFFYNRGRQKLNFKLNKKIKPFWKKLTQASPFYTYGYMLRLGGRKLKQLVNYKSRTDIKKYISYKVRRVNLDKFGSIKFKVNLFKENRKKRNRSVKKTLKINVARNPFNNTKLEQIWFTIFKNKNKQTLIIFSNSSDSVYYINIIKNLHCVINVSAAKKTLFLSKRKFLKINKPVFFIKLVSREKNIRSVFEEQPYQLQYLIDENLIESLQRSHGLAVERKEYTFKNKVPSYVDPQWLPENKILKMKLLRKFKIRLNRKRNEENKALLKKKIISKYKYNLTRRLIQLKAPTAELNFLNSLLFHKNWPITQEKYALKDARKFRNMKKLIKEAKEYMAYKGEFIEYDEYRAFKWKFFSKRWYFKMSRWKRTASFRWLMRKALRNYRKLSKNFMFIKLFRANFSLLIGMTELDLLKKWLLIRRGFNNNDTQSIVTRLNQSLQLKMDGIAMLLGLAPNRLVAQELVKCGGIRINGVVITNQQYSLAFNNMLQIDLNIHNNIKSLYQLTHWAKVKARLRFVGFLQATWPIMMFMLVRWPYKHEQLEESIFNERWVRFFIRYFPVRISKYKSAKVKWFKY